MMNECFDFDAVIVGSGFGSSVMASRLAAEGFSVCVLERGKAYPPGSFPRTPRGMAQNFWDPSEGLYGIYNVWSFRHLNALVSSGLGGGSLIYANVMLRKDEKWFVKEEPGRRGWEHWPITRADLEPHYDRVERMLAVRQYPFEHAPYSNTAKTRALQQAAQMLKLEWRLPPLAVTFGNDGDVPIPGEPIRAQPPNYHGRTRQTCRLCGECDIGCNYGSKNTLDYTYLSDAWRKGAKIRPLCDVKDLYPLENGGYGVRYVTHLPDAAPGQPRRAAAETIEARYLIVGAGALGSTYLLLRNRGFFAGLKSNSALGDRFCGNGDLLTFALRCRDKAYEKRRPLYQDGSFGPVITSAIRVPDELDGGSGRGFYIEDAGYPAFMGWFLEMTEAPATTRRAARVAWNRLRALMGMAPDTDIGAEIAEILGKCDLSSTSVPLLGMGRDVPDGRLTLREERLENDWSIKSSKVYFERMRDVKRAIAGAFGGRFADNIIWFLQNRVITVHPLGGCAMGRAHGEGVVDSFGEVFGHPGFFVTDGAAMPGPVGANPALTIAAFADRAADHLVEQDRRVRQGAGPRR